MALMDTDGRNPGLVGQRQVDEASTNIGSSSATITRAKSIDRSNRFPTEVIEPRRLIFCTASVKTLHQAVNTHQDTSI
jgi:hypothetical protein